MNRKLIVPLPSALLTPMHTLNWSKLTRFTLLLGTAALLAIASPAQFAQADEGADHLVPVEELPAPPTDPVTPSVPTRIVVATPPDPTRCYLGWAKLSRTEVTRAEWSDLLAMGALRTNPASGRIEVLSEIGACEVPPDGCLHRWAHYSSSPFEASLRNTRLSQAERQRITRVMEDLAFEEGRARRLPDGTWEAVDFDSCAASKEENRIVLLAPVTGTGSYFSSLNFWSRSGVTSGSMGSLSAYLGWVDDSVVLVGWSASGSAWVSSPLSNTICQGTRWAGIVGQTQLAYDYWVRFGNLAGPQGDPPRCSTQETVGATISGAVGGSSSFTPW